MPDKKIHKPIHGNFSRALGTGCLSLQRCTNQIWSKNTIPRRVIPNFPITASTLSPTKPSPGFYGYFWDKAAQDFKPAMLLLPWQQYVRGELYLYIIYDTCTSFCLGLFPAQIKAERPVIRLPPGKTLQRCRTAFSRKICGNDCWHNCLAAKP